MAEMPTQWRPLCCRNIDFCKSFHFSMKIASKMFNIIALHKILHDVIILRVSCFWLIIIESYSNSMFDINSYKVHSTWNQHTFRTFSGDILRFRWNLVHSSRPTSKWSTSNIALIGLQVPPIWRHENGGYDVSSQILIQFLPCNSSSNRATNIVLVSFFSSFQALSGGIENPRRDTLVAIEDSHWR